MAKESFQEELGKETLLIEKVKREKISSGIREFDEMIGGGFTPASVNLIQESLGCGGDILCYCIARANLNLSNKVLIIFADPLSRYLIKRLKKFDQTYITNSEKEKDIRFFSGQGLECGDNLYLLDLVKLSEKDITIMEDKHELKLRISTIINQFLSDIKESKEEYSEKFVICLSLNPFLLKLGESTLDIIYNSLIETSKNNYIQIFLMQKEIISQELKAKIQSMCHLVCDLKGKEIAGLTDHRIKILKHAGTVHDIKTEPYIVDYDRELDRYSFLIRGAFLTSFETLRNLLKYQNGAIYLANIPYLIAPVEYFNNLLEIGLNLTIEGGKREIHEKSQEIGRKLTNTTKSLYYLSDLDLFNATLRQLALFGFGNFVIDVYEKDENLIILTVNFQRSFHERSYKLFLKGLMEGIVRKSLKNSVRSIRIIKFEKDELDKELNRYKYKIIIRLSPLYDE
ncbi:MAG: RAD55 family ATPase [Promethearchaeota archaeon]